MKKQEIISVLAELHKITGFRVSLHGADYSEIAAYPEKKSDFCRGVHESADEYRACVSCDKAACREALARHDTYIYRCRYGFTEAVSPLYNFGTLTGFLMMGQVFECGTELPSSLSTLENRELLSHLESIPRVAPDMIRSYVKIMTICAQYLTLSNAIPNEKPTVGEVVKRFIHENYSEKIGIAQMCREVGCSKSTLITSFRKTYGTTVNKYLTEVRLGEALRMLRGGDMSIGEIAEAAGFSDQSYFSKVFSAKYGVPPSEYALRADRETVDN